ncbi:filamentous hemagglutinin N-terminal domain-containing protein [Bdellovibrionota bacterium]
MMIKRGNPQLNIKSIRCKVVLQLAAALVFTFSPAITLGNPSGGVVTSGQATVTHAPNQTTINQTSNKTIISWKDFSINSGETTQFVQPSSTAAALNRVRGVHPSAIYGNLSANGIVYLLNPNGIVVGPGGVINAAGFVGSTLDVTDEEFLNSNKLNFVGTSKAAIENLGKINANGGDVILIAHHVANEGEIRATDGTVGLAAGMEVLLTEDENNKIFIQPASLNEAVKSEEGITNKGLIAAANVELKAQGNMYALAVNHEGAIHATGVQKNSDGTVNLFAPGGRVKSTGIIKAKNYDQTGGKVNIQAKEIEITESAEINVSGEQGGGKIFIGDPETTTETYVGEEVVIFADAIEYGDGGEVIIWSKDLTEYYGTVFARGGAEGGDGGFVEVSGMDEVLYRGLANTLAPYGKIGLVLLDPPDVLIDAALAAAIALALPTTNFFINGNWIRQTAPVVGTGPSNPPYTTLAYSTVFGRIDLDASTTLTNVHFVLDATDINVNAPITVTHTTDVVTPNIEFITRYPNINALVTSEFNPTHPVPPAFPDDLLVRILYTTNATVGGNGPQTLSNSELALLDGKLKFDIDRANSTMIFNGMDGTALPLDYTFEADEFQFPVQLNRFPNDSVVTFRGSESVFSAVSAPDVIIPGANGELHIERIAPFSFWNMETFVANLFLNVDQGGVTINNYTDVTVHEIISNNAFNSIQAQSNLLFDGNLIIPATANINIVGGSNNFVAANDLTVQQDLTTLAGHLAFQAGGILDLDVNLDTRGPFFDGNISAGGLRINQAADKLWTGGRLTVRGDFSNMLGTLRASVPFSNPIMGSVVLQYLNPDYVELTPGKSFATVRLNATIEAVDDLGNPFGLVTIIPFGTIPGQILLQDNGIIKSRGITALAVDGALSLTRDNVIEEIYIIYNAPMKLINPTSPFPSDPTLVGIPIPGNYKLITDGYGGPAGLDLDLTTGSVALRTVADAVSLYGSAWAIYDLALDIEGDLIARTDLGFVFPGAPTIGDVAAGRYMLISAESLDGVSSSEGWGGLNWAFVPSVVPWPNNLAEVEFWYHSKDPSKVFNFAGDNTNFGIRHLGMQTWGVTGTGTGPSGVGLILPDLKFDTLNSIITPEIPTNSYLGLPIPGLELTGGVSQDPTSVGVFETESLDIYQVCAGDGSTCGTIEMLGEGNWFENLDVTAGSPVYLKGGPLDNRFVHRDTNPHFNITVENVTTNNNATGTYHPFSLDGTGIIRSAPGSRIDAFGIDLIAGRTVLVSPLDPQGGAIILDPTSVWDSHDGPILLDTRLPDTAVLDPLNPVPQIPQQNIQGVINAGTGTLTHGNAHSVYISGTETASSISYGRIDMPIDGIGVMEVGPNAAIYTDWVNAEIINGDLFLGSNLNEILGLDGFGALDSNVAGDAYINSLTGFRQVDQWNVGGSAELRSMSTGPFNGIFSDAPFLAGVDFTATALGGNFEESYANFISAITRDISIYASNDVILSNLTAGQNIRTISGRETVVHPDSAIWSSTGGNRVEIIAGTSNYILANTSLGALGGRVNVVSDFNRKYPTMDFDSKLFVADTVTVAADEVGWYVVSATYGSTIIPNYTFGGVPYTGYSEPELIGKVAWPAGWVPPPLANPWGKNPVLALQWLSWIYETYNPYIDDPIFQKIWVYPPQEFGDIYANENPNEEDPLTLIYTDNALVSYQEEYYRNICKLGLGPEVESSDRVPATVAHIEDFYSLEYENCDTHIEPERAEKIIAVVETGIDYKNPELASRATRKFGFVETVPAIEGRELASPVVIRCCMVD